MKGLNWKRCRSKQQQANAFNNNGPSRWSFDHSAHLSRVGSDSGLSAGCLFMLPPKKSQVSSRLSEPSIKREQIVGMNRNINPVSGVQITCSMLHFWIYSAKRRLYVVTSTIYVEHFLKRRANVKVRTILSTFSEISERHSWHHLPKAPAMMMGAKCFYLLLIQASSLLLLHSLHVCVNLWPYSIFFTIYGHKSEFPI